MLHLLEALLDGKVNSIAKCNNNHMHWNKKAHVSDLYVCQIIFGLQQLHTFAQVNNSSDAIKMDRTMIFIGRKENSVTKAFLHLAAFLLYLKCL